MIGVMACGSPSDRRQMDKGSGEKESYLRLMATPNTLCGTCDNPCNSKNSLTREKKAESISINATGILRLCTKTLPD